MKEVNFVIINISTGSLIENNDLIKSIYFSWIYLIRPYLWIISNKYLLFEN